METGELSVAEAVEALGTSAQTVRTMLRAGELAGERRPWGSRFVWVVHREAVDAFLRQYGRLDGRRRARGAATTQAGAPTELPSSSPLEPPETPLETPPETPTTTLSQTPAEVLSEPVPEPVPEQAPRRRRRLPWFLRVRGRATAVVLLIGVPALVGYLYARVIPAALWFEELGQLAVFRRVVETRVDLHLRVLGLVSVFVAANLLVACRRTILARRAAGVLTIGVASLVAGNIFATAATSDLSTYLLWQHRKPFGRTDPVSGKDVGFFVFSLPFYLEASTWLLVLFGLTIVIVVLAYRVRRLVGLWPVRVDRGARYHLAVLAAALLTATAWRLWLQQYILEIGQPSAGEPHSFAGAGFVDVTVTMPILRGLVVAALIIAALLLVGPLVVATFPRAARIVTVEAAITVAAPAALVAAVTPLVVQRYVVDPSPLVREEPYLASSLQATRAALGLDQIQVQPYQPEPEFDAADFADSLERFERVPTWDGYVLGARMRQLVTDTPYYRPDDPVPDVVRTADGPRLTAVSARELDLGAVPKRGDTWVSDRLAYTHGLGLLRFSSTDVGRHREPHLLDSGLGVQQPRIYYGNLRALSGEELGGVGEAKAASRDVRLLTPTLDADVATSSWVVANTERPEVDIPISQGAAAAADYHYDGSGGIRLSSMLRRAVFALTLGSKDLVLSDEITSDSRLLLHRDVHDRLETLAPFIQWDAEAVPLTANGHILYVVDGYTTSETYPYAERVWLGDRQVSYARGSVLATVDAFTGETTIFVTDEDEPVLRAWREIFPSLFHPSAELPSELQGRLRYPGDLVHAQATAYERYHTTRPDVFVNGSDNWARPLALSGPIEVAGNVDFDESDEDDLRQTLQPVYIWIPPPGQEKPRILAATYYTPAGGQNLVSALFGWIDGQGRQRLVARGLAREPVTLGPAQVSRLVFATPRVSNLLGLRNLEIRDLDKSSLDSVLLGRPKILLLQGGVVQIQNLYEGSRGPGAARLLGVTAYVNGRAGLGPDVVSAVRQALNEPPMVRIAPPVESVVVGKRTDLRFEVENARSELVTITSRNGEVRARLRVPTGTGSVSWVPTEAGEATVRVSVLGLDGTRTSATRTIDVLGPAPVVELLNEPRTAEVGTPVSIRFRVTNGVNALAEVSTRSGIVFSRTYKVHDGIGVVDWVPEEPGRARLVVRVRGTDGQQVRARLRLGVRVNTVAMPPTIAMIRAPRTATVGVETSFVLRAEGCRSVLARLTDVEGAVVREWRVTCPADPLRLLLTPTDPGDFRLTVQARGAGASSQVELPLTVMKPT